MSQFRPFVAGLDPSVDIFEEPRESLMTPAQTANLAGGFADPLGLVDIFGMYPEFPERGVSVEEMAMGPRSPSLLENIQNRDYLNSILQLAGVVPGAAGTSKALRQALRAYHGTPHRFPRGQRVRNKKTGQTYVADLDSPVHQKILESGNFELIGEPSDLGLFDMGRIGQGEGAQAYGRGLYFAEAEEVGKGYRDRLAPRDIEYEDELYRRYKQAEADQDYIRMEMLERAMMHDKPYEFRELAADVDYDEDYREAASRMAEEIEELNPNLGSLYTVDIDVDPDELLDWDKPISEQSEKVQKAVAGLIGPRAKPSIDGVGAAVLRGDKYAKKIATGRDVHNALHDMLTQGDRIKDLGGRADAGALEEVAARLRDSGIKGIKYLDEDSRFVSTLDSGKDLTSNYVIFDDELIKIVDRKREGGAVMQPFVAGLDPTIDIFDDPRGAEPLLTPAQAANVGGGFADPLGLIDIFGGYPAFPSDEMSVEEMLVGPRSPSLMENLRQGEYLDAALQAAGAIPIVGGAAKSLRAARGSMDEFKEILEAGIEAKDPNLRQMIDTHPAVLEAQAQIGRIPRTDLEPNYGTPEWQETRVFQFGKGDDAREVVGYSDAIDELYESSKKLAWTDDKMTYPGPAKASPEKTAIFVIGPPASGKSSISNPIARKYNATIIDPDEAKKILPEYAGGVGANAVHKESQAVTSMMQELAVAEGDNLVIPTVGEDADKLRAKIQRLRDAGYRVELVDVAVPAEDAAIRMFRRFGATGRIIPVEKLNSVGDNPSRTYDLLKEEGVADGYARIDNSVGQRDPKPVIEDDAGLLEGTDIRLAEGGGRRGSGGVYASRSGNDSAPIRAQKDEEKGIGSLRPPN
jgi:predicted kinase